MDVLEVAEDRFELLNVPGERLMMGMTIFADSEVGLVSSHTNAVW